MNTTWPVKAPSEIVERTWLVPTLADDSLASFVTTESGITKDAEELNGDEITLTLSAGVSATSGTVSITATTANGLIVTETFYQPILDDGRLLGNTVRDVCAYALRPVIGLGASATAEELADAQENLDDMLAEWVESGADLGIGLPTGSGDTLQVSDSFVSAIKANLRVRISELYGAPVNQMTYAIAQGGIQRIKSAILPDDRDGVDYF
jgi:hypothetical protein